MPARAHAALARDSEAASEVVGSILMIGITVALTAALASMTAVVLQPVDDLAADVSMRLSPGASGFGTGDEVITVSHHGGQGIQRDRVRIEIRINTAVNSFSGNDLDGGFADGRFSLGESWQRTFTVPQGALVTGGMVYEGPRGGSRLLADISVVASTGPNCAGDTTPPTAQTWVQNPSDLTTAHSGVVRVDLTVADDCAGVDTASPPTLQYRIRQTGAEPWTPLAMALQSGTTFRADIPEPVATWAAQASKTLEYQALNMRDLMGNTASSAIRTDLIEDPVTTQDTYPSSHVANTGSVSNFANLQSATDSEAVATMTEAGVAGAPSTTELAATQSTGDSGTNHENARPLPHDTTYALLVQNNRDFQVSGFPGQSGAITKVELMIRGNRIGAWVDDEVRVRYLINGVVQGSNKFVALPTTDGTFSFDVTSDRGSWSWSDIQNLAIEARYSKNAQEDPLDWRIDTLWLRVTVAPTVYRLDVELNFVSVPAGSAHNLQLRYRTTGDSFTLQVWQPGSSTWATRGSTLQSATLTDWPAYTLTASEYNSGAPRIRILDQTADLNQGSFLADYVRIRTTL